MLKNKLRKMLRDYALPVSAWRPEDLPIRLASMPSMGSSAPASIDPSGGQGRSEFGAVSARPPRARDPGLGRQLPRSLSVVDQLVRAGQQSLLVVPELR